MAGTAKFNSKHPAVKRIMQEMRELQSEDNPDFKAEALESNIFEWHFAINGPPDTEFQGGIYHGRILLPSEYPFKPPEFTLLSPNGRWETNTKICLSISSHHPEHWQPSWSVRTALLALIAFMPTPGSGAIGSLEFPKTERQRLAALSRTQPPKFGDSDRQDVITAMHARMLGKPLQEGEGLTSPQEATTQQPVSSPEPPAQQAVSSPEALAQGAVPSPTAVNRGISNADLAAAHKEAAARRARSQLGAPDPNALRPKTHRPEPPLQAPPALVRRDSHVQRRAETDVGQASVRGAQLTETETPNTQPSATERIESVMQDSSWEERGLNFLAIAIGLAILAILGRKAFAGVDIAGFL